jgi:ABC-type transport system involved in multi-copper enzyme maturation permease subunit
MAHRIGPGPVFAFEWLTSSRRWQGYAIRSLFVAALLAAMVFVWSSEVGGRGAVTTRMLAQAGEMFYHALVGTQLVLVLLAAPAATAGAICLDKARGTLAHLLVTDLSDAEIVLGKLLARLIPALGLVACALPVMALATLLGGVDPKALTGAFLVALGTAALGCALALALSVWGTKTHEVLLLTYAILILWVLGGPAVYMFRWTWGGTWQLPEWLTDSNPFWLTIAPYSSPGAVTLADDLTFLAATLGLSATLTVLAIARLRAVATRQAGRPGRGWRWLRSWRRHFPTRPWLWTRWLPGPSLDGNPVLWREWHRNRPTRWGGLVWALYVAASLVVTFMMIALSVGSSRSQLEIGSVLVGGQVALGFLIVSVTAATTLAEERVRGSLDVLLATPMSTASIVWGKWWGAYRAVPWLAVLPAVSTTVAGISSGDLMAVPMVVGLILAFGAALAGLGLALATWTPRLGRAVALTVAAYLLVTVGWFFLIVMFTSGTPGAWGPGLASASPFIGVIFPMVEMHRQHGGDWAACIAWLTFWILFYTAVAAGLFVLTLLSFDRCLGRVSAISYALDPIPRSVPKPSSAARPKPA